MKSDVSMCSVCAGTGKPISGLPCVCGGIGTEQAEMHGLRVEVFRLLEENDKLTKKISEYENADISDLVYPDWVKDQVTTAERYKDDELFTGSLLGAVWWLADKLTLRTKFCNLWRQKAQELENSLTPVIYELQSDDQTRKAQTQS